MSTTQVFLLHKLQRHLQQQQPPKELPLLHTLVHLLLHQLVHLPLPALLLLTEAPVQALVHRLFHHHHHHHHQLRCNHRRVLLFLPTLTSVKPLISFSFWIVLNQLIPLTTIMTSGNLSNILEDHSL